MLQNIGFIRLLLVAVPLLLHNKAFSQGCCSGGSGSPIAGGTSQGVLLDRQVEVSTSFQYNNSKKFLTGTTPTTNFLDNYNSKYLYTRIAYGVTQNLTMSIEGGYFLNRTQIGLNKRDTVSSKGFGDLVIFPRYTVYNHNTEETRNEVTVGMGWKMPIGKHFDSTVVYTDPNTGKEYFTPKPPAVVTTTGSNDFILYGFAYRGYIASQLRFFTSMLYVRKGWNSLGQKFGDYKSISIYAGKTVYKNVGVTLQIKGEWIDKMDYDKKVDMLALYNLDVTSTGGKTFYFVPQLSYSYNSFFVYLMDEIPFYQYINGTAIATQHLITIGLSYRFLTYKTE